MRRRAMRRTCNSSPFWFRSWRPASQVRFSAFPKYVKNDWRLNIMGAAGAIVFHLQFTVTDGAA
ncbi:hypothetical protein LGH83_14630 [Lichenihabitans sp. PAMC28606]|uniref:hypothetical protein n=1 Tax=Lichenihabitans sp. PAMC28606 TaxID=2880932 RepID=UPI001D0BD02B|nr:hypothetical protein [Lichenihabitans sp. PAMC28606]UDL93784.1 hypothetical protein LGH83_14630 [Lichenihabitans sp. PAMC28606]